MAGQTGTLTGFWDEIITYLLRGDKQHTITAWRIKSLLGSIVAMIAFSVTFLSIAFFGLDAATNIYAVALGISSFSLNSILLSGTVFLLYLLFATRKFLLIGVIFTAFLHINFAHILYLGNDNGSGAIWYLLLPIVAVNILGGWRGLFYSALILIFALLIFYFPQSPLFDWLSRNGVYRFTNAIAYSDVFKVTYLVILTVIILLVFLFDKLRNKLELALQTQNTTQQEQNAELDKSLKELHMMHDQLLQSEKMAILGRLVSGMSHEINTPIGIGVTAVSHVLEETYAMQDKLKKKTLSESDLTEYLDTQVDTGLMIQNNLKRAANLIASFKNVAVDQAKEERRVFDVGDYITEVLHSLRPSFKKQKHELIIDCPENTVINSFPGSFSQILTNLVINSVTHAFDDEKPGQMKVQVRAKEKLKITFTDNGKGIDKATQKKIFDPFFTTNRNNGGTGLGLAIVHTIVTQQLGGTIRCVSPPNNGTTFIIEIPLAEGVKL
jgi:signal transduction histidine kinase